MSQYRARWHVHALCAGLILGLRKPNSRARRPNSRAPTPSHVRGGVTQDTIEPKTYLRLGLDARGRAQGIFTLQAGCQQKPSCPGQHKTVFFGVRQRDFCRKKGGALSAKFFVPLWKTGYPKISTPPSGGASNVPTAGSWPSAENSMSQRPQEKNRLPLAGSSRSSHSPLRRAPRPTVR